MLDEINFVQQRAQVEAFLLSEMEFRTTSRSPLEKPWLLSEADFTRRVSRADRGLFRTVREQTAALTDEIQRLEDEIDRRVAALYHVVRN